MKKITISLLTMCLILGTLTAGYTQDADPDPLQASDINADGIIDILDLTLIAAHFGKTPAADLALNPDVNDDGLINILDLTLVASHFGKTVPIPVVVSTPEFVVANPAIGSQLAIDNTITVAFGNPPEDVNVSAGVATVTDKIVEIKGPFTPGQLALTITWTGGTQTLTYTVRVPDTEAPQITSGTVTDSVTDVDPEVINSNAQIVVEFNEPVSGNIALQTESGDDVGWLGSVSGNKAVLELVKGKEISHALTYVIKGKVRDAAGNATDLSITFMTLPPPVAFVSAAPGTGSQLAVDDTITLTFDNVPDDVTVSTGTATIADTIVTIAGPFEPGDLALSVTWADGTQTLNYTVRSPVAFVRANPASGATLDSDDTITLTFDERPRDVEMNTDRARTTGKTVRISGPFDPGDLALTITWADGSETLNYIVRTPDTDAPKITSSTVADGKKDVDPEQVNSSRRLEITFNEPVSGNIELQTESGVDVGWISSISGNKARLTLAAGKEIDNETTYVIKGKVSDAAGNSTDLNIRFTTASKTFDTLFEVTDATFDSLVLNSELPIMVEFYTDW